MAVRLAVTVSPGAKRSRILGRHGDGWKVAVAAAPERGRANEALIGLLAGALAVPQTSVRVVAGRTSRRKAVEVDGLGAAEAERRLTSAAARP